MSHESPSPVHAHTFVFRTGETQDTPLITAALRRKHRSKQEACVSYYLNKKNNEEIEVGYPSELLEQVLGDKIPNCVLKEKKREKNFLFITVREQLMEENRHGRPRGA